MLQQALNNQNIAQAVTQAQEFMDHGKLTQKDAMLTSLALEETLLNYQETLGEEGEFAIRFTRRLGRLRIELSIPGERQDPFPQADEEGAELMRGIMGGMGFAPVWQYKNGVNLVTFTPRREKPSQFRTLLAAVVLAVVLGGLCLLLPEGVRLFLADDLLGPLFTTCMGLLTAVSGPMVFLSVAWGVYGIGDTTTLSQVGKRMIGRILLMSLLIALLAAVLYLPFFPFVTSGSSGFHFRELFQIVLDIVPDNFLTPFTEGNPIQIIFLATLLGMCLLILGNKAATVSSVLEQGNYIIQLVMEGMSSLIPFFVFSSIFNMILHGNLKVLKSAYKLLPLMLLGYVILLALYVLLVAVRRRVNPVVLLKKMLPTFFIGLTTASSSAALSTNVACCKEELGIDQRIVSFGVPLGQVVFMPGCIIMFFIAALCMAENYQMDITLSWVATAVLICIVLAVAAPPVPGGGPACYAMLVMQLGLPADAVAVLIALDVVLEFPATAMNLICLQTELVELAGDLNLLDEQVLRSRSTAPDKEKMDQSL